jgi:hypothetical protein
MIKCRELLVQDTSLNQRSSKNFLVEALTASFQQGEWS